MIPIKNPKEAEKMRLACRVASDILDRVVAIIRPGITTKEVDEAAAEMMQEAGVKSAFLGYRIGHRVYPGNICISLNDEVIHGIASQRRIQYGDIVKLDIGVIREGWIGDTATTVPVGEVADDLLKLIRVAEESLDLAIEKCRAGNHLGDIGFAVQQHAESHGYSIVREYVGHGIGRHMHEDPQIPNYGRPGKGPKIRTGYVFAVEPMINIGSHHTKTLKDGWTVVTVDGKPSAHVEHTIAITEEGPEVLTLVKEAAGADSKPVTA